MGEEERRLGSAARRPRSSPLFLQTVDLNTFLLRSRVIFVGSRITDEVGMEEREAGGEPSTASVCATHHNHPFPLLQSSVRTVAALMALNAIDPDAMITMYINSGGGSPYAAVGVVDCMRAVANPIRTVAMGFVGTTATLLLAAGTKGERYAMPSSRIMLHQPVGGAAGSADEVNITTTELNRTMRVCNLFLAEATGRPEEELEAIGDRPYFMSPREAVTFGLVDAVLPSRGTGVAPVPPAEVTAALGRA